MIKSFRQQLSQEIFKEALFRSHINSGEECLKHSQRTQAIQQFIQAWKYKPLNIVPIKKMIKTLFHLFKKDPSLALP
jgi:hypothetical protein